MSGERDTMDIPVRLVRHVTVFDAADVASVSRFWAALLSGRVVDSDERFHCVIDHSGNWVIGVQYAPGHVPPEWPEGNPQQVHVDLHVEDPVAAIAHAVSVGARVLLAADDPTSDAGHQVLADPAGHPFCIGWGHPDDDALRRYLATLPPLPE